MEVKHPLLYVPSPSPVGKFRQSTLNNSISLPVRAQVFLDKCAVSVLGEYLRKEQTHLDLTVAIYNRSQQYAPKSKRQ